jgi:hypothetical protein
VHVDENFSPSMEKTRERERKRERERERLKREQ